MPTGKNGSIIQISQKLIGRLPKEIDDELTILIRRAEEGEDTAVEIIDLLSPHETIRLWMREQVDLLSGTRGETAGYGPLPGRPGSIPASKKWVCPKRSCDESLPLIQEGEDAPTCPVHDGFMMIRGDQKKG